MIFVSDFLSGTSVFVTSILLAGIFRKLRTGLCGSEVEIRTDFFWIEFGILEGLGGWGVA